MGALSSNMGALPGRIVRAVMVVVVLPFALGLLLSLLSQLEFATLSGSTFREWMISGFLTYVGVHVLLWRPAALFRVSRQIFSSIAVWLFGGQVTSVEDVSPGKGAAKAKEGSGDGEAVQGSTLVAFSPYVVPVYTVLVCVGGWALSRWNMRNLLDGPIAFLIGVTMAFHWMMTADELQAQRKRWHLETYLLALSLVFVMTLLVAAACLPWAVPELSFIRVLAEGLNRTQDIYTTMVYQLFR